MRESGFLSLPCTRTLRDYTHHVKSGIGFLPQVTEQLIKEARVDSLKNYETHVALCFDEVRIRENLVYDKYGVRIIGYIDLGCVNNELLKFESSVRVMRLKHQGLYFLLPNTCLCLWSVEYLLTNFPFAQFPTQSLSSDQLFPIVWEAVEKLEAADFKVIAFVCDGASQNRKIFRMHSSDSIFKTNNPYAGEPSPIYFFSDAPHLIKTVRNCWANSFCHKKHCPKKIDHEK